MKLRRWPVLACVLALLVFFFEIGRRDITTSHEARVAVVARQMAESGWPWNAQPLTVRQPQVRQTEAGLRLAADENAPTIRVNPWVVPVLSEQIRLQKPPLAYWCAGLAARVLGFSEGVVRLPGALLGALGTLLVWDVGRRVLGRRGGWLAALVWVSSYFVADEYRKVMSDPYVGFCVLVGVWAWVRRLWIVFYLALGAGALAKGPIILPLLLIPAMAWRAGRQRWWKHLAGLGIIALVTLPWLVAVLRQVPGALELWRYESLGNLADKNENARPWWFYLPNLPMVLMPWTPLCVVGAIVAVRRRRKAWFPLVWLAASVLVLSALNQKKNAYLLPVMPAAALLGAQGLLWLRAAAREKAAEILLIAQKAIGVGAGVVLVVLLARGKAHAWVLAASTGAVIVALLATLAHRRRSGAALAVSYAAVVAVFIGLYAPQKDNRRSFAPLAPWVTAELSAPGTTLMTGGALPEAAAVYLPLVQYDPQAGRALLISTDPKAAQQAYPNARVMEIRSRNWSVLEVWR